MFYFTDHVNIYQIYLIDESGKRRITGKGELFTDPTNEHFESILYSPGAKNQPVDAFSKCFKMYFYILFFGKAGVRGVLLTAKNPLL